MGGRVKVKRHLVIPDTQIKPGVPTWHIAAAARYAAEKEPDVIIQLGDWHDMPSLSSYDRGKRSAEGRRYRDDIEAGNTALDLFERELKKNARRGYKPRKVQTRGNHEQRVATAANEDPRMFGTIGFHDFNWERHGWGVYPFLQPVEIDGILTAHFWPVGTNGRVTQSKNGCPSAAAQVQRVGRSCTAGHAQGLSVACIPSPTGLRRGLIAGSFYDHDEEYLTPMGAPHWKGVALLNDIRDNGFYDLCEVSLEFLRRNYA